MDAARSSNRETLSHGGHDLLKNIPLIRSDLIGHQAHFSLLFMTDSRNPANRLTLYFQVKDYFPKGKRYWFGLHEKGGKYHEVPAHHLAEEFLDAYIEMAGISDEPKSPLWRTTRGRS
jgi:hypothetical protein